MASQHGLIYYVCYFSRKTQLQPELFIIRSHKLKIYTVNIKESSSTVFQVSQCNPITSNSHSTYKSAMSIIRLTPQSSICMNLSSRYTQRISNYALASILKSNGYHLTSRNVLKMAETGLRRVDLTEKPHTKRHHFHNTCQQIQRQL